MTSIETLLNQMCERKIGARQETGGKCFLQTLKTIMLERVEFLFLSLMVQK